MQERSCTKDIYSPIKEDNSRYCSQYCHNVRIIFGEIIVSSKLVKEKKRDIKHDGGVTLTSSVTLHFSADRCFTHRVHRDFIWTIMRIYDHAKSISISLYFFIAYKRIKYKKRSSKKTGSRYLAAYVYDIRSSGREIRRTECYWSSAMISEDFRSNMNNGGSPWWFSRRYLTGDWSYITYIRNSESISKVT